MRACKKRKHGAGDLDSQPVIERHKRKAGVLKSGMDFTYYCRHCGTLSCEHIGKKGRIEKGCIGWVRLDPALKRRTWENADGSEKPQLRKVCSMRISFINWLYLIKRLSPAVDPREKRMTRGILYLIERYLEEGDWGRDLLEYEEESDGYRKEAFSVSLPFSVHDEVVSKCKAVGIPRSRFYSYLLDRSREDTARVDGYRLEDLYFNDE